ncbi:autotransporter outer membrane beta-barrel domain-containing protein [Microvirga puerhi]|uniref:Autotransporter outer membrane beta-barrel domain-containing protein n=1 Tax=Microvirga puerhi TaxID=2876078 RepID=A0ABS7VJL7_9HYPH|nr:autotransporter outer membrane beta-barrel domain-containing protein [Microvirga puerhi]MBZ6075710.1 autotransporter outer membrane beta-barrel domain-containing protein [Microvirga puerhi]
MTRATGSDGGTSPAVMRSAHALLSGVSLVAVLTVLAGAAAHADEVSKWLGIGLSGKDAQNLGWFRTSAATQAQPGGSLSIINNYSTTAANGPAVEIGSIGGNGGNGFRSVGFVGGEPATPGAPGGTLTITQDGVLGGAGDQSNPTALLLLYSRGGTSGNHIVDVPPGGRGGDVMLVANKAVRAVGNNYAAIWVRSIGGNSGKSEGSTEAAYRSTSAGGAGGAVSVTVAKNAVISTKGTNAPAIIAESVGGEGSKRSYSTTWSAPYPTDGGAGGTVTFVNNGTVSTEGAASPAVLLQSLGGQGGQQARLADGGQPGGTGGRSDEVKGTNAGTITTKGDYSFGIIAQSVGGSGGRGAGGYFGGGDGGRAGTPGKVEVTNQGTLATQGAGAHAIVAQSIGGGNAINAFAVGPIKPANAGDPTAGGGGGMGGASFFLGKGGVGGMGGNGGTVTVAQGGAITTQSENAYGILAQSIGGGGGRGGDADSFNTFVGVAIGGRGGGGGNGGDVLIVPTPPLPTLAGAPLPSITTWGKLSTAVIAQSVGGGGGAGGTASATSAGIDVSVAVAVGGAGGDGGSGGDVSIVNGSVITTHGLESHGIQAQSIGGGGGAAGSAKAYALAIAPPETLDFGVSFAVGGSGGGGGSAKTVTVTNLAKVTTQSDKSYGIQAISVGGGGGTSGSAASVVDLLGTYLNFGLGVSVGGSGGGGGNGSTVTVVNEGKRDKDGNFTSGIIETHGAFSTGIMAHSIGGGGGDGGPASASAASGLSWNETIGEITKAALPLGSSYTGKFEIGGSGGGGGNGGGVSVVNDGSVLTYGNNARGIFAQSVGGGGGDGGGYQASGTGKPATVKQGTFSAKLDIGGRGGDGGVGGQVFVNNSLGGVVETYGNGSAGIVAQSIGGGGGSGGAFGGKQKAAADFGEDPGKFIYQVTDELLKSDQVLVFLLGDKDKKQNVADYKFFDKHAPQQKKLSKAKDILSALKVLTDKDKSWPQRITQAGGTLGAGYALNKLKDYLKDNYAGKKVESVPDVELTVTLGKTGGKGGNGGEVGAYNEGSIITHGDNSWGLFAQSIGGGGGQGGGALSTGNNKVNANVSLGGSGAEGGDGGKVSVRQLGSIATSGAGAFGIVAQSVGGGGGIGGIATSANTVSVSGTFKLGGSNGKSSPGGSVEVSNSGTIATKGREAHALVAQSVGGGGGVSFLTRVDPADPTVLATTQTEKEALEAAFGLLKNLGLIEDGSILDRSTNIVAMPNLSLGLGGSGGPGGKGGDVTVTHSGTISTAGLGAFGIFAQSVGGGGGFAADASKVGYMESGVTLGGSGGIGGKGGDVRLNFEGKSSITTTGEGASAVFLQSIGGGGGYGGAGAIKAPSGPQPLTLVRDDATSGDGGAIRVEMRDSATALSSMAIKASGARAHGIFAQSIGGGGGTAFDVNGKAFAEPFSGATRRNAAGQGGLIFVSTNGSIEATGSGAYGFYGQSGVQKTDGTLDPTRTGGNIVFKHVGTVTGGSGDGAAVRIDGGGASNFIIAEYGSRFSAVSGTAILGSFGREEVFNRGTIIGDVNLVFGNPNGREENVFNNETSGLYASGTQGIVNLGTGGVFHNRGAFAVAGTEFIGKAMVTGRYQQEASGSLLVDVTSTPAPGQARSDLLTLTGPSRLDGRLVAGVVGGLRPETFTVLTAKDDTSGTMTGAGNPAAPFTWRADRVGQTMTITPSANFAAPAGAVVSNSERNAIDYLQRIWSSGRISDKDAHRFGYFARVGSTQDYLAAVDRISPEESASSSTIQTMGARDSMHFAMSCPVFASTGTLMEETSCVWGRMIGNWTQQSGTAEADGYRRDAVTLRTGLQREFATDWFFGATAGLSLSSLSDADGFSNTSGMTGDIALSVKHQIGPWLLAASGHLGWGRYETERYLGLGEGGSITRGDADVFTAAARFRASYELAFSNWYMKPYADIDVIHTSLPAHTEAGLGFGSGLAFGAARQWNFAFSPNIEVGARVDLAPDMWLRPYVSAGLTMFAKDSLSMRVNFSDTDPQLAPFLTHVTMPDILGNATVGAQVYNTKGYEIRAEYRADFGRDYLSQEVSARVAIPF